MRKTKKEKRWLIKEALYEFVRDVQKVQDDHADCETYPCDAWMDMEDVMDKCVERILNG